MSQHPCPSRSGQNQGGQYADTARPTSLYFGKSAKLQKARAQLALHLRAFQAVKDRFISEQGTSVSVAEFVNAVYTSDQDENNRRGQEAQKQAEGRAHQCGPDGFAVEEDEVVDRSSNEDEERENLKGESAQGNVDTRLVGPCRVG